MGEGKISVIWGLCLGRKVGAGFEQDLEGLSCLMNMRLGRKSRETGVCLD